MADTTPATETEEVTITDPVEMAIIEIAAIAERYDNYGEFRAHLKDMSAGLYKIAENKAKEDAKPAAKK